MNEDKASRYQRLSRRASVLSVALSAAFFLVLLTSGASVFVRDLAASTVAGFPDALRASAIVALFVGLLAAAHEALSLPLAYYRGHLLERRYGLSVQSAARWFRDHLKSGAIGLAFAIAGSELIYAAIRRFPNAWWAIAAAVLSAVVVGLAQLAPVVLMPLFYRFAPIDRDALRERLVALAKRTGARVVGAYEWKVSDRTARANAALTGLGATRRILLSDTLLTQYSDDEIEVILAHELAHHVHGDIWTGIACETALLFGGMYGAHRALHAIGPAAGIADPADVAGLPIIVLAAGAISLVVLPLANALSRAHEWRADRFALELTRNPGAFISAMKRLGAQNLAEAAPSRLVQVLFHTHPPFAQRIAAARAWEGGQS